MKNGNERRDTSEPGCCCRGPLIRCMDDAFRSAPRRLSRPSPPRFSARSPSTVAGGTSSVSTPVGLSAAGGAALIPPRCRAHGPRRVAPRVRDRVRTAARDNARSCARKQLGHVGARQRVVPVSEAGTPEGTCRAATYLSRLIIEGVHTPGHHRPTDGPAKDAVSCKPRSDGLSAAQFGLTTAPSSRVLMLRITTATPCIISDSTALPLTLTSKRSRVGPAR